MRTVRELPDRIVVDFGPKWFVFYKNKRIVKKVAKGGRVVSKEITSPFVRRQIQRFCGLESS